jgi:hypothetical protein
MEVSGQLHAPATLHPEKSCSKVTVTLFFGFENKTGTIKITAQYLETLLLLADLFGKLSVLWMEKI